MIPGPLRTVLMTGATATGPSPAVDVSSYSNLVVYFTSTGTTSGGTVLVEEAEWDPNQGQNFTGTWVPVTTIAASSFSPTAIAVYHLPSPACYGFVRVRISATITGGGTIAAVLRGN
jgi:hypothetical protein